MIQDTSTLPLTLSVISLVSNVILTIGLFIVSRHVKRVDGLEEKLTDQNQRYIDDKFNELKRGQDLIADRLNKGDREFREQHDRDHELEMKFVQRIEALHRTIIEHFATKQEVKDLRQKYDTDRLRNGSQQ